MDTFFDNHVFNYDFWNENDPARRLMRKSIFDALIEIKCVMYVFYSGCFMMGLLITYFKWSIINPIKALLVGVVSLSCQVIFWICVALRLLLIFIYRVGQWSKAKMKYVWTNNWATECIADVIDFVWYEFLEEKYL